MQEQEAARPHALVVDDSSAMRCLLSTILETMGWQVTEAIHGLEALDLVRSNRYDLALVDWHMPEMTGIELVRTIRAETLDGSRLPIMMVTCESQPENVAAALEAGVDEYTTKPFDLASLEAKLTRLGFVTS